MLEPGAVLTTFVSPKESRFFSCPALFTMFPGRLAPSCDGARIPPNYNDQPAQACTASSVCMGVVRAAAKAKREVADKIGYALLERTCPEAGVAGYAAA